MSISSGYYRWPSLHKNLVVFVSEDVLWKLNIDTMSLSKLTESGRASYPRISPDGKFVAYVSNDEGDNEVYLVPRVNTVKGMLTQHIQKWGWRVDEKGWVNWPDYQWRIWKNKPEIKWKNKVHEVLEGHKKYAPLPAMEDLCLYHHKTIEKQEKQNNFYEKLL